MMRKTMMAFGMLIIFYSALSHIPTINYAQQETPVYAKWGQLVMKETELKYPHAKIVDYLHVARESNSDQTIETFKLWLKEGDKEFGVYVIITFVTETEKIVTIDFQETSK